jgi:hypothetical protein
MLRNWDILTAKQQWSRECQPNLKARSAPPDVIGNAAHVMKILTGEIEETIPDDGKDPAAKALSKKGGAARAKSMTPERRAEFAKAAAAKRWSTKP